MNLNFLTKKRKALWFKFVQNILFFWKSPKSVWQCFHFFYFNLFESFQTNFVEISSFLRKKCFQTKICVNMTSQRMYEPTRCMEAAAYKQREQKEVGTNHCPVKGQLSSDRWSLCKSLQKLKLTFLIHHNPTFHLRVKNQRIISFFSLNFLRWC